MKPFICKENRSGISLPEVCQISDWLVPVAQVEDIKNPNRLHAYITPENKVYVLNQQGTGLAILEENVIANITKNGTPLKIADKTVNLDLSPYEEKANKVGEINETATTNQYASAKAVYDYVDKIIDHSKGAKLAFGIAKRTGNHTFTLQIPILGSTRSEINGSLILVYFENTIEAQNTGEVEEIMINSVAFGTRKEFLDIPGTNSDLGKRPLIKDLLEKRALVLIDNIAFTEGLESHARIFEMENMDGDSMIKNENGRWEVSTHWLKTYFDLEKPTVLASDVKTVANSNVQAELDLINEAGWVTTNRLSDSSVSGDKIDDSVLLKIYPVGAIYISVVNTNPSTLFGGVWTAFATGRTLVGVDTSQTEFNTIEKAGGATTHTLTVNEIPAHTHQIYNRNYHVAARTDVSLDIAGNHGSSMIASGATGGGLAHNNLPPYLTVYMWKRTE